MKMNDPQNSKKRIETTHQPVKSSGGLGHKKILWIVFSYLLIVSLIVGIPFYRVIVAPERQTILQIGKTSVSSGDLIKRMRLKPAGTGINQLEWATSMLQEIQNLELIRQEAINQEISVSNQELDQEIRRRVMSVAGAENKFEDLYLSMLRGMRLTDEQYKDWVKTDLYQRKLFKRFFDKAPVKAEQVHVYALVVGTNDKADAIRAALSKGEDFSKLAKGNSIDLESARKGGDLGWIPLKTNDLITSGQLLSRGILTKTKEEAEQVREKILAGKNFAELARTLSLDDETRATGGILGWVALDDQGGKSFVIEAYSLNPGEVSPPIRSPQGFWVIQLIEKTPRGKVFDDIAFTLPVGKVSPPLNTIKGIYFIKVVARDPGRELTQEQRTLLTQKTFLEWLTALAQKGAREGWIKWNWGSETYNWVIKHLE